MPRHLHLDYETFSKIELKDVGAYRYANDPSTAILCAAMAFDQEEPVVWRQGMTPPFNLAVYAEHMEALRNPTVLIYAHNAMFEIAISQAMMRKTWGIMPPSLDRWRCTMSMARRAALPSGLDQLGEVLKLTHQKDKRGKALIKKFSVMQSPDKPTKKNPVIPPERLVPYRIRPEDDPEAFAEFMSYCAQDVRTEQEVAKVLSYFDEPINNENFVLDQIINARGVPVNLAALAHAQKLVEEETAVVSQQFRELTGFEVTQGEVFKDWLNARNCNFENLQAETIETFLEDGHAAVDEEGEKVIRALRMKQSIAYAAIKKIPTMLACAGPHDNRIRGMLSHHGATTGRWTASLVQFQNMKRPTIKNSEDAYRDICAGISLEMLRLTYGPPLEVISSCIRHFVEDV